MPKAIIFDVDGTLVDSVKLHAMAWQDAFRDFGRDHDLQALHDQIGKGGDQLLPVFMSAEDIEKDGERLEEHRGKILKSRYLDQIVAFPSVRALLQRLLDDGKVIALASSAKQEELSHYKKLADIDDLLQAETSSDDAERSKPHPDIFQAALKKLGVAPADAIVVGDTPYDAEAATKAGVRTVGLLCGGWSEADLLEAGCIAVFRDPADLLDRYAASPLSGD
ncbi:HAD family hydrolase [Lichenihabitans sp. Uapishka_5]|uniref:HAD family hydrolase n=1 Tax=Lichenihabitans sp. Uapishka_5 TaxID=3037302 RepID=UPI0029E7CB8A|nr:HAD family hydrolase [Lichenihabitans sp. Uapishka_5]MDX7951359.1 HAD family hydrolase [Lichenihabitans sp. Uapishka_5]